MKFLNHILVLILVLVASVGQTPIERHTFAVVDDDTFSFTNKFSVNRIHATRPETKSNSDGATTSNGRLTIQFASDSDLVRFTFNSALAGGQPEGRYHIQSRPGGKMNKARQGFTIHLVEWDARGQLLSVAIDFDGGKLRYNSHVP